MWRNVYLAAVLFCFCFGLHCTSQPTQSAATEADGGILVGKPVTEKNLTVFPLYLKQAKDVPDYITLDEALEAKSVEVREVGAGREPSGQQPQRMEQQQAPQQPAQQQEPQRMQQQAAPQQQPAQQEQEFDQAAAQVNAVEIENKSERPLYILAGQVIIGGKQDRVLARDTIIPPDKKLQVEVCCVEHGRWSPRMQQGAQEGGVFFAAQGASVTRSLKAPMVLEGKEAQQKVWTEIAKQSKEMGAETPTGTYTEVMEKTDKTVTECVEAIEKSFGDDKEVCGFLACINGEVETCDLFASPKLLSKFRTQLLRGYALDSIAAEKKEKIEEVTVEAAKEFINDSVAAQKNAKTLVKDEHRRVDKIEGKSVIGVENYYINRSGNLESAHTNTYKK